MDSGRAAFHEARYLDALDSYRAAYKTAEQNGLSAELRGQILTAIGACLLGLSDYKAALAQLLQARPHVVQGGNREHLAALDVNIASIYLYQGDLDNAARTARRALGWLDGNPRSSKRAPILANLAVIELRNRRYQQALQYLRRAAQASADRNVEAAVDDLRGLAYLGLRDYARARQSFEEGLAIRRAMGGAVDFTRSLMLLGRTEMERGDPAAAVEKLNESVALARQRQSRVNLWEAHYLRGRAFWKLGRLSQAVEDLRRSVELLESIRLKLVPTDALRVQFEVSHSEVYSALADLLCEEHFAEGKTGPAAEAFRAVELGRAQSLRALVRSRQGEAGAAESTLWMRYADRLARLETTGSRWAAAEALGGPPDLARQWSRRLAEQEADLRDFEARIRAEDPVLSSGVFAPALELGQTQEQVLGPASLLLSFYAGAKASYLWAVTRSDARFYRLPPSAQWIGEVRRFARAVQVSSPETSALGRRLYRVLLGQVDPALLQRRHWIIAADGDLISLPFCVLPAPGVGGSTRYLVEDHSFSYTPSASVLYGLKGWTARTYRYDLLAVADPVLNRADARWKVLPAAVDTGERLPRLVSSASEVRACARLFAPGKSVLLTGFNASETELRRLAKDSFRYWHFSSHIVVDREHPSLSFIALSMPRQGAGIEKLTVFDILGLPVRAEMVLLSGCDSGTGKNLPGAGMLGLARAFLAAGAQSVCVTRWKIPDEKGALVESLYAHLLRDGALAADRADALRQSQIEMIRAGDWRSQPRYWAAYFMVGSHENQPSHAGPDQLSPTRRVDSSH